MIKTGIDLVEISRIQKSMENPRFLTRVFSEEELEYFQQKGAHKIESAAANFAAKEAFSKALGTGVRGFSLREVSVLRDKLGAPFLSLSKKAAQLAQGYEISLSLTHTAHYASAVVILTKNQNERKE